ncbi:MAG TPA: hypothetical protein VGJ05_13830 [Fimbriiglobus sp.]|jgi:hypothetical protein
MTRILFAGLALAITAIPAFAIRAMAPETPAVRAVLNPIVVIGKITAIEADPVQAAPVPGSKETVPFKLAVLKIETALSGAGGETHLKIGFREPPTGGPRRIRPPGGFGFAPKVGLEGVFFLTPHPSGGFVVIPPMSPPLEITGPKYKEELAAVKKALTVVEKPTAALAAKNQPDRYFAAAVLLSKYGTAPANATKVEREPVSADESKLLIAALLETDWTKPQPFGVPAPSILFWKLQLGPEDGWNPAPVKGGTNVAIHFKTELQKWYAAHGEKYQVKKYVEKK